MKMPFIIGIAGPTGSGKSTLTEHIAKTLPGKVHIVHMDDYFINPALMPIFEGEHNWDDPRALDIQQLLKEMRELRQRPGYSVIILEGFLVLHFARLRKMLDFSLFLGAPIEVTLARRVHDAHEHYRTHVIPAMNKKYVLPSSRYADYIFDVGSQSQDEILRRVLEMLPLKSK